MFAYKSLIEMTTRMLLIATILFNALAISPAPVQAKQEEAIKTGRVESRSVREFPTFARPSANVAERDGQLNYIAPSISTSQSIVTDTSGVEGLQLEQNWVGWGNPNLSADWIVQKSGSGDNETIDTFYSSALPKGTKALQNYARQFSYTVKSTEAGPNNWLSFQLAGLGYNTGGDQTAGVNRARFYVDIVSLSGSPVTCNSNTTGWMSICVQDSVSHIHGMADSGGGYYTYMAPNFNYGGGSARVAVKNLTVGDELIVTFGSANYVNDQNTLSSNEKCFCAAGSSYGVKGRPINTRTGNYEYYTQDISMPTSAGELRFTRDYVSAITAYSTALSPGWTHNLDTRLIFPSDPEGQTNKVIFKAHTANRYVFHITNTSADRYIPEPGLSATLVKNQTTPVTYTLTEQGQSTYRFDDTGKLLTFADAQDHTWTYTYNPNGSLHRVTDDGGKFLELGYDVQGRINLVKDHTDRSVFYTYNANGDLDTFTDVLNQVWTYEYNDLTLNHYLTRVAAPGNVTLERQEYYPDGRAYRQYDGEDKLIVELSYLTEMPLQFPGNFDFESGDLSGWSIVSGNAFSPLDVTTSVQSGNGQIFNQHGSYHLWGYKEGGDGQIGVLRSDTVTLQTHHPIVRFLIGGGNDINNLYVSLVRAADGTELFKATGQNSEIYSQTVWDASAYAGQDVYIKVVDNATGSWGHVNIDHVEIFNDVTVTTDALGNTNSHYYNSRGTLVGDSNSAGESQKEYDSTFRPGVITDSLGNSTGLKWSLNGTNLSQVKDALQNTTNITYGDYNNPTGIIDPLTHETKYFYNDPNFPSLPTRIEYPLSFDGGVTYIGTDYEYYPLSSGTSAGRVKFVTDALGNKTYYEYNAAGQTTKVTTGFGTATVLTTTYVYDTLGRLTDATDPQGIVTHNEYDAAGRLLKTTQNYDTARPQNDENKYNLVSEYRYDLRGNQIAVIDTYGTITRTYYDLDNRPVTTIQNLAGQTIEAVIPPARGTNPEENIRMDTVYDDAGNVIATIDPAGIVTRTYYDAANRPVTTVQNLTGRDISVVTPPTYNIASPDQNIRTDTVYDANGNVIASIDTLGIITRTYYDALNRPVTTVQHLMGQTVSVTTPPARGSNFNIRSDMVYDANGNVIATVDPKDVITRTYYDALDRPVTTVQNLVGQAISNSNPPAAGNSDTNIRTDTYYDKAGNVIATVDPRGVVTRTYYDSANRPYATVQNLAGQDIYIDTPPQAVSGGPDENIRTDIAYDAFGRKDLTTDPFERATKYEYNEIGQLVKVIGNYVNGGLPQNASNEYNLVTAYEYDALGRQVKVKDTLDSVTFSIYDDLGRLSVSIQNYDASRPQNDKDAQGNQYNLKTFFTYDVRGNQIAVKDTNDIVTRTYYDVLGRPATVVRNYTGNINDPAAPERGMPPSSTANLRTDTIYLGNGNVDYVLDEMGAQTDYSYDALGHMTTIIDPLSKSTNYEFDANGNRTLLTDAEGIATHYEYDNLNRLKAVVENYVPSSNPGVETNVRTEYTYDANGNRLSIRDGNSFLEDLDYRTVFTYDDLGRLKTETDAESHEWLYGYDKLGNRISLLDANGQETIYGYDTLNRLELINYPAPDADVSFDYDALGRRLSMTDGLGTTSWVYTNLDQPSLITDPFGTGVSYDYDALGNRTSLSYGSQSYGYHYNDLNRLDMVTGSGVSTQVLYQYDAAGRLETVTRPNNVDTTYYYDDNGWLQDISHTSGVAILASYEYLNYNDGNRSQAIEHVQNPQFAAMPSGAFTSLNPQSALTLPNPISAAFNVNYKPASQKPINSSTPQSIDFARLPLSFVANLGQFDKDVKFQTNSLGGSIFFTPSEVALILMENKKSKDHEEKSESATTSKVVRIEYLNAEQNPAVEGLELQPGIANFMVGSDKKAWVANAPTYAGVIYRTLYPGIDLRYEGAEGSLKSTFTVAPGADSALIQWQYKEAGEVSLDADGNLRITLPALKAGETETTLVEHAPVAWQDVDGQRMDVPVQYALTPKGEISFVFPQGYDASLPLTIDPVLTYGTYLGGNGTDRGYDVTTDANGNAYLTGYSYCGNFPTVNPLQQGGAGFMDVIISKISADGSTLLYSTCVGGTGDDIGDNIALDPQGRIVVVGQTVSTDFPIVSGISTFGGGTCPTDYDCTDLFVLRLASDGSAVQFSTYLGGDGRDASGGVAVDASGNILVVGSSTSTNFPTMNPYDNTYGGNTVCAVSTPCYDVTVTKIDPDLTGVNAILYSTYLGGTNRDKSEAMTLDANGFVYLTGYSESDGYPTRNALQATREDGKDLIVTVIDPSLSGDASLLYSSYLGGNDGDRGQGIARDANGNLYLTGYTSSYNFPMRDPLQPLSHASACGAAVCYDAFVTKLNISTNTIVYSTYLGGSMDEEANGIAVDSYGRAYVTGYTRSSDFPTYQAIQPTKAADGCATAPCADAFLSVLEPDGQTYAYSTYLGGDQDDVANEIALDSNNYVYVVGDSYSTNFLTTEGAYDRINAQTNNRDAFIVKVDALSIPPAATSMHLDVAVSAGSDDAEQSATGGVSLTSTDLELIRDSSNQKVGIRFAGVNIPQGAIILNAEIQFTVDEVTSEATTLTIRAQANDNASTFTTTANNISSRPVTVASVSWTPAAWNNDDEGGPDQRTPNLASVVQDIINRPGWTPGNALAFIITGSGQRIAKSYERNVYSAPYLHIEYIESSEPPPPPGGTIVTLQPDGASGDDTYIVSSSSTTNYGTSADMGVGENNNSTNKFARGLVKFDLSAIPTNATITSATLSLWTSNDYSDNDSTVGVYRLKVPFNETQATWNIASAGVNWQSPGASGANDRESVEIGSVQILANEPLNTEKQIQLSSAKIQEMINGSAANHGFILVANTELNNRFDYKTSDTSTASNRPKLVIAYTISAPATPTFTPTATATATATATQTATQTPTFTPTATATATSTPTGTATFTPTPTGTPIPSGPITINYIYDPLNRLTAANYSNGDYYHYTYDAVGNRKSQITFIGGLTSTTTYNYDHANRLMDVGGVAYDYDDNGSLLDDGATTYTYDSANRLKTLTNTTTTATYSYNGLNDRLRETVNGVTTIFTMDLNAGLTQALSDGTNHYIYGLGRIAQVNTTTEYFLGDALGSMRQLTDQTGAITYARAYDPYGVATQTSGTSQTSYGYTGEFTSNDMVYLRTRYYSSGDGRFFTRDIWMGNYDNPMSLNRWNYVSGNPVNYVDPSGLMQCPWNIAINTCDIYDWYNLVFGGLYRAFGINTNMYMPTSSGNINLSGAVTSQYLQFVEPLANTYYTAGEIGLNAFPLGAYDFAQSISGTNLLGQPLSSEERRIMAFWGMLGLGDCFPGFRFAPDGVNSGGVPGGQLHHILSNPIMRALNNHPILRGVFSRDDYLVRAAGKLDHNGYQTWHRLYDKEVPEWLIKHSNATRDEFIKFLREIYSRPSIKKAFPGALDMLK